MPSSSFVSPSNQKYRTTVFNDKSGRSVPYEPFPNRRKSRTITMSKPKKQNPFSLNVPHMSYY